MEKNFNEFRFEGLNFKSISNNYLTMNRVSENNDKIVVKVDDNHLVETPFGFALILDRTHVVFLKKWQVSKNHFGNEVLLNKDYFNVKTWGEHDNFFDSEENFTFENWLEIAKNQNDSVKWENNSKKEFSKMKYGY